MVNPHLHHHPIISISTKQQEAYCNLCERSFCNKYFLKTHFAKKHGGLNLLSPSPSPPIDHTNNNNNQQPLPLVINEKLSEDYCEVCEIENFEKLSYHFSLAYFRFVKNVFVINIIFV